MAVRSESDIVEAAAALLRAANRMAAEHGENAMRVQRCGVACEALLWAAGHPSRISHLIGEEIAAARLEGG